MAVMTAGPAQAVAAQAGSRSASRAEKAAAANISAVLGPGHAGSGIVPWAGRDWLATAVQPYGSQQYTADDDATLVDVQVFGWDGTAWAVQGMLSVADLGSVPSVPLHVRAVALAGLPGPNFEVSAGPWGAGTVSVVAAVHGAWRALPFLAQYGRTTTVGGGAVSAGLVAVTNLCSPCQANSASSLWYRYTGGAFKQASPPGPAPSCTPSSLPGASWPGGAGSVFRVAPQVEYGKVACADGFALAIGQQAGHEVAVLFHRLGTMWSQLATTDEIPPVAVADHLDVRALARLGAQLGGPAAAATAAALIGGEAMEVQQEIPFGWVISAMVERAGRSWVATGGLAPTRKGGPVVQAAMVYRWTGKCWLRVGTVPLGVPTGMAPGMVQAVSLTGSAQPDFQFVGSGADEAPSSVISDAGGAWHAVPFVYGDGLSTMVDGYVIRGRLYQTVLDASGGAAGPYSELWETYRDGAFRPSDPPGPVPGCSVDALEQLFELFGGPWEASPLFQFGRVACADGWALAEGTGAAYTGHVIALFDQQAGAWQVLQVNDGTDLAYEVGEYDLPALLFQRLGEQLGPTVAPEVQAALPPAWLGLPADATLTGIMDAGGGPWVLALAPGPTPSRVSVDILRWRGRRWAVQGMVGPAPAFASLVAFAQYSVVGLAGSPLPAFEVSGTSPAWNAVIGYLGGRWKIVKMSGR